MRTFFLKSVKEKNEELKLENYNDITFRSFGVDYRSEKLVKSTAFIAPVENIGISGISFGYSDDNGDVFFKDGYLINDKDEKILLNRFDNPPFIVRAKISGENIKIAISKGVGYLFGKSHGNILVPKGEKYIFYDGKIFTFCKNKLSFCTLNKSTENGYVMLPLFAGEITDALNYDEGLYVICEKTIIKVASDKKSGFFVDIKEKGNFFFDKNSAMATADGIVLTANGKLFVYKNERVEEIKSLLDNGKYSFAGDSAVKDGKYIISVSDGNEEYFFVKDFVSKAESFIKKGNKSSVGNGNFFDFVNGIKYVLSKDGGNGYMWESKPFEFTEKKTVFGIRLYSETDAVMKVKGDFGTFVFAVKAGNNSFRTKLKSKKFSFVFEFGNGNFALGEQVISYRD
ncbi:MAG: hypothetical protein J6Y43_07215 [Clostridia bacterium]|nr:hypothetical protein [Clostridia bacterium]